MAGQLYQKSDSNRSQAGFLPPAAYVVRSVLAAAVIVAISWGFLRLSVGSADRQARQNLLMRARTAAALIEPGDIDESEEALMRLRPRLRALREASDDARFVYIAQPVDDQIVILADSEHEESPEYSPPGASIFTATLNDTALFGKAEPGVVGPRTDSTGAWITAYAPIALDRAGHPVAFLVFDIEASAWSRRSMNHWWPVLVSVGLLAALAAFILISKGNSESRHAHYLATRDYLTGLANRAALLHEIDRAIRRAKNGTPSALLVIDIDNFKALNDTLTHSMGDEILVGVAAHVKKMVRKSDLVARIAGDEFAVLLVDASRDEARLTAERIRSSLENLRFEVGSMPVYLTVSAGMAEINRDGHTRDVSLRADMALAAAKKAGKNRVEFDSSSAISAPNGNFGSYADTLAIEGALKGDRLLVYLQPIVPISRERSQEFGSKNHDLAKTRCFEALIRMVGPDNTVIPAGKFVPVAEGLGLIPHIDMWVLDHVIQLLSSKPNIEVAVNLSPRSIARPSFLAEVEQKAAASGIASRLYFEITETAAMGNLGEVRAWMNRMKELGCSFAIDDFGAGHSAISYLYELPIDVVKIAGNVVQSMQDPASGKLIIEAINSVSHVLGATTVAECVEDGESLKALQDMGVDFAQGYYFARPMPADEAVA